MILKCPFSIIFKVDHELFPLFHTVSNAYNNNTNQDENNGGIKSSSKITSTTFLASALLLLFASY